MVMLGENSRNSTQNQNQQQQQQQQQQHPPQQSRKHTSSNNNSGGGGGGGGGVGANSSNGSMGGNSNLGGDDAAGGGGGSVPPPPPQPVLRLWGDVAAGIDKSQTVIWKSAVDSLTEANRFLRTSDDARRFVEKYMRPVISILLEQQPSKIGQMEKSCVEDSLYLSVLIVAEDLRSKVNIEDGECKVLEVLAMVFNRKKIFYKGSKPSWNVNLSGLPEVRMRMITKFRTIRGFSALATYLSARVSSTQFPPLQTLHWLLGATVDAIPTHNGSSEQANKVRMMEDEAIRVAQAVMDFMSEASEDCLKRQSHESLGTVRYDLQHIFDRLLPSRRKDTYAFYSFWRKLALKLITSQSLPLKLVGWESVNELIDASKDMGPPPRSFIVSDAGCAFVNGKYKYAGAMTEDGYALAADKIMYELVIPDTVPGSEGAGKKLTLFRCTMRSQQKWWFLSEADEEQPGTDKDVDYYQHKSKQHEENLPPATGWVTCRSAGVDPPPVLRPSGVMVPKGEEYNTLEHQLARWAIKNDIIQLVLGDSVHREIVNRSAQLVKFLASMCEKDEPVEPLEGEGAQATKMTPNAFCLLPSHLLLAWKTCTSKADAAVSAEVYQLLVSILPDLPSDLAIPLLREIQKSLQDSSDKRNYLFEVAEFCTALATGSHMDIDGNTNSNGNSVASLTSDDVRAEILKLLWAVLVHPASSTLKNYERLKSYVMLEISDKPSGTSHRENALHREKFLLSCKEYLTKNAELSSMEDHSVDEPLALRMVKLTRFVLEACPVDQAVAMVTADDAALAALFFRELTAYLNRRAPTRKVPQNGVNAFPETTDHHSNALSERLLIIRYTYGLSDRADMTTQQLDLLWSLCVDSVDREALMVFLAKASNAEAGSTDASGKQPLAAAYSDEVRVYAFQNLFCADIDWEELGEGAYQSFQMLFKSLRRSVMTSMALNGPALDALWRICLTAGNDDVAAQAMKDLLAVYSATAANSRQAAAATPSGVWNKNDSSEPAASPQPSDESTFAQRVFDCLVKVKEGLKAGDPTSERSSERCLRILNVAIGHTNATGATKLTSSTISPTALAAISNSKTLSSVLQSVPHGMRGQSCYRMIGIMAKRTSTQQHPPLRDEAGNILSANPLPRPKSSERFSLLVHPLETLSSIKAKVAVHCGHQLALVKPLSVSGRANFGGRNSDSTSMSLNVVPDDSLVAQVGIVEGAEVVFLLANHALPASSGGSGKGALKKQSLDLGEIFEEGSASDRFFDTLLAVLEALPVGDGEENKSDTNKLVWDLLLSMSTNKGVVDRVRSAAHQGVNEGEEMGSQEVTAGDEDFMVVDSPRRDAEWSALLNLDTFHRSVYVMQVIDSFLRPSPEILSSLPEDNAKRFKKDMEQDALSFRKGFIESGGFDAVLRFFTEAGPVQNQIRRKTRMGSAVALRILKCCFFHDPDAVSSLSNSALPADSLDSSGQALLKSLSDPKSLMNSLTSVVVDDSGVSDAAILDVLLLLRLLLLSNPGMTDIFASLPNNIAENFLIALLLWESRGTLTVATANSGSRIRNGAEELILMIPALSDRALPWLIKALDTVDVASDGTSEFFSVLRKLVDGGYGEKEDDSNLMSSSLESHLKELATAVCKKLASHPRPTGDSAMIDFSTGVLCGCLSLLRAIIETGGGVPLADGVAVLMKAVDSPSWSEIHNKKSTKGVLGVISSQFRSKSEDLALIDLMGAIFDSFLSSVEVASSTAICCDKESRQLGFEVIAASAKACKGGNGYEALVHRINGIIAIAAPSLRHRWGHNVSADERGNRLMNNASKYSGLRNQGCTCYMNSVLQQLFMMPGLQENLCSATLPSSLRSAGGGTNAKGADLVNKKISLHWDSGVSYDAIVKGYDESTNMHTIQYCPLQIATVGGPQGHAAGGMHHQSQQIQPEDVASLPEELPDEFILTEGRPGRETGAFEIISASSLDATERRVGAAGESSQEGDSFVEVTTGGIEETEDEASSRRLLEEVQRTFVHLDEGSRGRCFDPRSLVEASACLKLEFDVWQQNDASEFAMKLLDRLEISLKKWSPQHFKYLEDTFGLKQTKQKICKQCGLKTNREENLMNIDCQIRGKADIHEALSTMCEVEFMEGDNKVFCDRCKQKCDTVLRTAISALPDMLVLSLKRFDLDYNTFETVKLNSRCAFGQTLNMKKYTLAGVEAAEKAKATEDEENADEDASMDVEETPETEKVDSVSELPDEDYEYNLVGVLVHAGVAQGGHYYSFIKDRSPKKGEEEDRWYRFDDEDVTPFDPSSIEQECFGGKVKRETKWPNGQVHTVENEQFANALMLFYEKVKPSNVEIKEDPDSNEDCPMDEKDSIKPDIETNSGFDVFQPDVRRSNTTHGWQAFLFDAEFQSFFKGLLELCHMSPGSTSDMNISTPTPSPTSQSSLPDGSNAHWRLALLQMGLHYIFDIILHSSDKEVLSDWTSKLLLILRHDGEGAKNFVHQLARRTGMVSGNWLRKYCAECPEEASRVAGIQIIVAGMKSSTAFRNEQAALSSWTAAWRSQVEERARLLATRRQPHGAMPTQLEGEWKVKEDVEKLDSGASSIGIIISALSLLLEVAPRTWRYNSDLCLLLRDLGSAKVELGGKFLREAMIEAQIPARLICLAIRERAPPALRAAFPGASVSLEVADALVKTETPPSSLHLPMGGTAVGMGTAVGAPGGNPTMPSATDHLNLLEALGSIIGIEEVTRAQLVEETGDFLKGRPLIKLTKPASDALGVIFNESMSPSVGGMGQRDIQNYLKLCGLDASTVPPQRIASILGKYPTTNVVEGGKETRYLNLDGFLAYYRDTAQTNEAQVRSDLHTFGYRPDLSRRSEEARFHTQGERKRPYQSVESVAFDIATASKDGKLGKLGQLAETGLVSFHLYSLAYSACDHIAEYILSACSYGRDTSRLLSDSLKALYRAPAGWAGSETADACLMVFKVLAALPDERQQERITALMQSTEKAHQHAESGVGLLVAAKEVSSISRASQHYGNEYHNHNAGAFERYVDALKELQKQRDVYKWMSEHRSLWNWMEQWLRADVGTQQQARGDHMGRRDGGQVHHQGQHHSDSDMGVEVNDSEDDDEDSTYGYNSEGGKVVVSGAGVEAVNGTYTRSGSFDNVGKFTKVGLWKGREEVTFSLFRCRLSDNTRRWYISIVPKNIQPGTNKDLDFYSAPVVQDHAYPPESRWMTAKDHGVEPPPYLTWKADPIADGDEDPSDGGRVWTDGDDVMDDDGDDDGQRNFM